jgi:hypothetical protein
MNMYFDTGMCFFKATQTLKTLQHVRHCESDIALVVPLCHPHQTQSARDTQPCQSTMFTFNWKQGCVEAIISFHN